jgi:hypothetical protein
MAQDEAGGSGPRMIDGATMERIRAISTVLKQLQGVAQQLTAVRDGLATGERDPRQEALALRTSVGALADCALTLDALAEPRDRRPADPDAATPS